MFFFNWIKKILFQSSEEDISEEKDKLNLVQIKNIKEPKKENKSDKNAIIRLIAVISFFILMYFFIKFMRKEEKVFQNRSYKILLYRHFYNNESENYICQLYMFNDLINFNYYFYNIYRMSNFLLFLLIIYTS